MDKAEKIYSRINGAQLECNAFFVTGDSSYIAQSQSSKRLILSDIEGLRLLTPANADQHKRMDRLGVLFMDFSEAADSIITASKRTPYSQVYARKFALVSNQSRTMIRHVIDEIKTSEEALLIIREKAKNNANAPISIS